MADWYGLPTEFVAAIIGAVAGALAIYIFALPTKKSEAAERRRERAYEEFYEPMQQELYELLHWNLNWMDNPWGSKQPLRKGFESGAFHDPDHAKLFDALANLFEREKAQHEAFSQMHSSFKRELEMTLEETTVKTKQGNVPVAQILGSTFYDPALLRSVYDKTPSVWPERLRYYLIGNASFGSHGRGTYDYKEPVEGNLDSELMKGFERQARVSADVIKSYQESIETLLAQARVIEAGLRLSRKQRKFYPGKARRWFALRE